MVTFTVMTAKFSMHQIGCQEQLVIVNPNCLCMQSKGGLAEEAPNPPTFILFLHAFFNKSLAGHLIFTHFNHGNKDFTLTFSPQWDRPPILPKFGATPLTSAFIRDAMNGIHEPAATPWFPVAILCFTILLAPITELDVPPLTADGTTLAWAPHVIRGIPAWAFRIIMVMIPITVILLYSIYSMPDSLFPEGLAPGHDTKALNMHFTVDESLSDAPSRDETNIDTENVG